MSGPRRALQASLDAGVFPGAVALVSRHGDTVLSEATGRLGASSEAPPVTPGTIYDLASITKVFTSTAVLTLVDRGLVALEDPIGRFLPRLPDDKRALTVRQLLVHTAGLPYRDGLARLHRTPETLAAALTKVPLNRPPDRRVNYSSLGYIYLGWMIEAVASAGLDVYLQEAVIRPCGLRETRFTPPPEWKPRIAPLEYTKVPGGWVMQGLVYDYRSQILGGVTGHAGLFAPAEDVRRFGEALLDPAHPVLGASRSLLFENLTAGLRQRRSAGFVIDDPALAPDGRTTYSHTGFTGTSLCLVPERGLVAVLLTNRLNPIREDTRIAAARHSFHHALWRAVD